MAINGTKIGVLAPQSDQFSSWDEIRQYVLTAEQVGLDSIWFVDHMLINVAEFMEQHGRTAPDWMRELPSTGFRECWSLMSAAAAITRRVEIGTLVSCTGYRNPALLAKIAETVDEISDGRVILGLGSGDSHAEFDAFGYSREKPVGRFEEALQIITQLLRQGRSNVSGEFYTVNDVELRPRGPRPEGIPVLIGALENRPRMTRLVMQYADIWNNWVAFGDSSPEEAARRVAFVAETCEAFERDPETLQVSLTIGVSWNGPIMGQDRPLTGSDTELADQLHRIIEHGVGHIQIRPNPYTRESVERLASVLEVLRA